MRTEIGLHPNKKQVKLDKIKMLKDHMFVSVDKAEFNYISTVKYFFFKMNF